MDKILFGSDFPQWTVNETLEAIKELGLTAEETEQIRYKNALELLSK